MFTERQEFIKLKDYNWLAKQKQAGICVAHILKNCKKLIEDKTPNLSLRDLEEHALSYMKHMNCTPTFKNYKGFPSAICTSVNNQLVHGIVTDYVLKEGDIVTVDLGATFEGAIADAAYTAVYGEPKSKEIIRMLNTCKGALYAGIKAANIGNRIGAIGKAIHSYVKDSGFGLIVNYGGHGIDWNTPHANPFVANRAELNEGIRIQPGLTIAIEPQLVLNGNTKTRILDDKWTVVVEDLCCHFEHTIFVESKDKIHILTEFTK